MLDALRIYEVTQEKQWLDDGKKLHARIREYYDGTYGGGVWWKRDGTRFKNVPINAPYVIASMKLVKLTGEDRYKKDAVEVYTWMESKLFHKPVVEDGINDTGLVSSAYTYNYGTFVGASVAMYDETGDARYRENAVSAADHAIATLAPGGIVKDEGLVALSWNERDKTESVFAREYEELLLQYGTDYKEVDHSRTGMEKARVFWQGAEVTLSVYPNAQLLDRTALHGRVDSSSYVPHAGEKGHGELHAELDGLFDRHQREGVVPFVYRCDLHVGRLVTP